MRNIIASVLLVSVAGVVSSANAQRLEPPLFSPSPMPTWLAGAPSGLQLRPTSLPLPDSAAIRPTHWVEGGLIGAAIGTGGLALLAGLLYDPDSGGTASRSEVVVSAALIGGVSGFVIGALIGGASPKPAAP